MRKRVEVPTNACHYKAWMTKDAERSRMTWHESEKRGDQTPFQQKAKLLSQRQPLSTSLVGVIVPRVPVPVFTMS